MKIVKSHFTLGLIAAAIVTLTACGGGGSTVATNTNPVPTIARTSKTVTVMDGLIQNALVCVDSNANGVCDATEIQGHTDLDGQVTLDILTADLATAKLVAVVTAGLSTDKDTGSIPTSYTMQTPVGKLDVSDPVISPLTNMVQTKIDADHAAGTTTSVADADHYVISQLGLNNMQVSAFDNFVAKSAEGSTEHKKAGERAHVLVVSTQTSITSATASAVTVAVTGSSTGTSAPGVSDNSSHSVEIHVENNLLTQLSDIGKVSDKVEHMACATNSTNVAQDCKTEIENEVHSNHLDSLDAGTGRGAGTTPAAPAAPAASATAGKALYVANGCGGCHGTPPSMSKIMNGANSPSTISGAIGSVGAMSSFSGKFTAQNLADIAAYLATPKI